MCLGTFQSLFYAGSGYPLHSEAGVCELCPLDADELFKVNAISIVFECFIREY